MFLQGHKDNTLSEASNQDLDGNGVIELASMSQWWMFT